MPFGLWALSRLLPWLGCPIGSRMQYCPARPRSMGTATLAPADRPADANRATTCSKRLGSDRIRHVLGVRCSGVPREAGRDAPGNRDDLVATCFGRARRRSWILACRRPGQVMRAGRREESRSRYQERCRATSRRGTLDRPGESGAIRAPIAHGIEHDNPSSMWCHQEFRGFLGDPGIPLRTRRFFCNSFLISSLREQRRQSFPVSFTIRTWTGRDFAGPPEPFREPRTRDHEPRTLRLAFVPQR